MLFVALAIIGIFCVAHFFLFLLIRVTIWLMIEIIFAVRGAFIR